MVQYLDVFDNISVKCTRYMKSTKIFSKIFLESNSLITQITYNIIEHIGFKKQLKCVSFETFSFITATKKWN